MRIYYDIETNPSREYVDRVLLELEKVDYQQEHFDYMQTLKEGGAARKREEEIHEKTNWDEKTDEILAEKIEERLATAALHWTTGQVVCATIRTMGQEFTWEGDDEKKILNMLAFELNNFWVPETSVLIGKHAEQFDRPFLIGRYMANDLGVPDMLRFPGNVTDVEHIWGKYNKHKPGKLGDIAVALGLEGKLAKGSNVRDMVENEQWAELAAYNQQDVRLCEQIFARYDKKWTGQ